MAESERPLSNPVAPLGRLLTSTLTVADIVSTPLWSISPTMPVADAVRAMTNRSFDMGGVAPEPPLHYVQLSDLQTAAAEGYGADAILKYAKHIPASQCIEKSLPVSTLLELFETNRRLFVLDGNSVRWVITHADLIAPAVGIAVLSFLAVIEAGLKHLASSISDEELVSLLSPKRQEKVRGVHEGRTARGIETSLRDCLFLEDWLATAGARPELLVQLGYSSKSALHTETGSFGKVRDDLAHGRTLLANEDTAAEQVLDRVRRIREFASKVWGAVEHRRPIWDAYATTVLRVGADPTTIIAGAGATAEWEYEGTVFVLTAWNPGSVWVSAERNEAANERLASALSDRGARFVPAVGHASDGDGHEDGFLVEGLAPTAVAELARLFGQNAYFEIDAEYLRVCDANTMVCVRAVDRFTGMAAGGADSG